MVALSLLLSACGPKATPAATAAALHRCRHRGSRSPLLTEPRRLLPLAAKTYVLVPKNLGNPYFDTANKGAQEAAKELGVTVIYQGPGHRRCHRADPAPQLADRPEGQRPGHLRR